MPLRLVSRANCGKLVQAALERADRRDRRALVVQRHRHHVEAAILLAHQVLAGHTHVLEEDLVGPTVAHRPQRAYGYARRIEGHDHQRNAAMLGLVCVCSRGQPDVGGVVGGGGVNLLAVDDVVVAVGDGPCLERAQVGACGRLGVAEGELELAVEYARQILLALLFGASAEQRRPDRGQAQAAVGQSVVAQLFGEDELVQQGLAAAAVLFGPADSEQPFLAQQQLELAARHRRRAVRRALNLGDHLGGHFVANERADVFSELLLLWCKTKVHRVSRSTCSPAPPDVREAISRREGVSRRADQRPRSLAGVGLANRTGPGGFKFACSFPPQRLTFPH